MTGNIGRPGTGANSITGQCNAMGSRLFSNTTNLLGGHDFANPDHRAKVAALLEHPRGAHPDRAELGVRPDHRGIRDGEIRGLWVIATNPAHSWIDQGELREILGQLDFLVVQDMYHSTETARLADLLLPAAGWGEKEGTFINSERRIGLIKKVRRAPGQALSDFHIFKLVAHYYGCGDAVRGVGVARGGLPDPQAALGGPALRHHAASPTTRCSTSRGGSSGRTRRRTPTRARSGGSSPTAGSITPTAAPGSSSRSRGRCPSRRTTSSRFCS